MTSSGLLREPPVGRRRRDALLPTTRLGARAVELGAASALFLLGWLVGPGGGFLAFACGLAGGLAALVAILRGERAVGVVAALVPFVLVVGYVLAALLAG